MKHMLTAINALKDIISATAHATEYSLINLGKHPLRWILFIIIMCIPLVNFIILGMLLKIEWGQEFRFTNPLTTWFNGFRALIIVLLYELVPILLIFASLIEHLYAHMSHEEIDSLIDIINSVIPNIIGYNASGILATVLPLFFLMLAIPAEICFARKGFLAAFDLDEEIKIVRIAGWGKFIAAFIFQTLLGTAIYAIYVSIGSISDIGAIIAVILACILVPHFTVVQGKFWSLFFEKSADGEITKA
ncbi:MAG TPA: DUF4013 domain-containing protein [Methanocorpusculum sp.]|nr:DUF4013 domain-containing protein [Methanocorpusculum sp.]